MNLLINLPHSFFTTPWLEERFAKLAALGEIRQASHYTAEAMLPDLKWAEAVIMWTWPTLDEQVLAQAPRLKFLGAINTARTTARTCLNRGIAISETRHCWSPAVAESALGLMLAGLRRTSDYHAQMRAGAERWVAAVPADIDPFERQLTGLTVGIVGFGAIGRRLAELLEPFHVSLLAYDPYVPREALAGKGARPATVLEIARASDVVVLCAAEAQGSRHVFDANAINAMKPMGVLVNIGRSLLIDMEALSARLKRGDLIAMLDVFDIEPLPADSPLRTLPNTYLTPHRAGGLRQSVENAIDWLTADLMNCLENKPGKYAVTEAMLPSLVDFVAGNVVK